ncbi:MAG: hypothetical protein HY590_06780, partial [Candidatus Omnitrophica bacterium]|nr:hypothetical protein [Candidatus Omnitrophota bacterium]
MNRNILFLFLFGYLFFFRIIESAYSADTQKQNPLQNFSVESHAPQDIKKHPSKQHIRFTGNGNFPSVDKENRPLKFLKAQVEVEILEEGTYGIMGELMKGDNVIAMRPTYQSSMSSETAITERPGRYFVTLMFSGEDIFGSGMDGPYQLTAYAFDQNTLMDGPPFAAFTFTTPAYRHENFGELGIRLINVVQEQAVDEDKDGEMNHLKLSIGIQIRQPGHYFVEGTLRLSQQDETFSYASQTIDAGQIGEQTIDLFFPGGDIQASGRNGPYGGIISAYSDVSSSGSLKFISKKYASSQFQKAVVISETFNEQPLDNDGNGIYDNLQISFDMIVDSYRKVNIYGWLTLKKENHNIASTDVSLNLIPGKNTISLN